MTGFEGDLEATVRLEQASVAHIFDCIYQRRHQYVFRTDWPLTALPFDETLDIEHQ